MDNRDINSICDVDRLDRAVRRTARYEPTPDPLLEHLGPWIAAVIIVAFVIWILGVTI